MNTSYQSAEEGVPLMAKTEQVVENKPKTQYLGKIVALLVLAVVSFTAYTAGAKNVAASAMRFNSQGDGPPACVETCAYTCMETNYYSLAAACPCFQQCDISSCSVEDTKFVVGFVTGGCMDQPDDDKYENVPAYPPATADYGSAGAATASGMAYCDDSGCCTSDPAGIYCVTQNPTAMPCYPLDVPCSGFTGAAAAAPTKLGANVPAYPPATGDDHPLTDGGDYHLPTGDHHLDLSRGRGRVMVKTRSSMANRTPVAVR